MGDSGSQVLGFAVACFGLLTSYKVAGSTAATLLLPILILAVPILDTTLVTVVRLLEGRPVHQGGRDHASHRLVYHGLSEKRSVVLLALVAAALGGTSFAYSVLNNTLVTLFGVLLTFALLVQFASLLSDADRDRSSGTSFFAVHRRRFVEVVVDFALICAAFLAAYLLRVEGEGTVTQRFIFTTALPILLVSRYLAFIPFGLYRGVWRYAGARDAVAVVAAVVTSEFVAFGVLAATRDLGDFPKSVFVIDALICIVLVGASRFWERAAARGLSSFHTTRRRTLIVGAGRGGRSLLRELRETPGEHVVGFVDDDPRLRRRRLQGVPVVGGTAGDRPRARADAPRHRAGHDPGGRARAARRGRRGVRGGRRDVPVRATRSRPRSRRRSRVGRRVSVASARAAAVPRPWVDRLLAAVPILSIYLWLCVLYGWEASGHVTIWLNSDELEMAQLSRAVAETGETARRGVPYPSHALYPYVLAPVWWIQDVGQAYGVAKLLNVLLMTSVVFPAYGLARMVVSKPWALFAAAGAGVIPALYYSSILVEEPARLPVGDAVRVLDREGVRATDPVVDRRRRAGVARRSPRSRAARRRSCGVRDRGARARGDEPSREARVLALVALGLGRRRPAARRPRDRPQCCGLARLVRLAGRDAALQGPHARERPLGRRRARGRGRCPPDDRRPRRARPSARRGVDAPSDAQSSRRWDR